MKANFIARPTAVSGTSCARGRNASNARVSSPLATDRAPFFSAVASALQPRRAVQGYRRSYGLARSGSQTDELTRPNANLDPEAPAPPGLLFFNPRGKYGSGTSDTSWAVL
jgi:hypothetical protein